MKEVSRKVRRMSRHHNMAKGSGLNLVSLMDIFTILVFFLLVNSSSTQQLPNVKDLKLPVSVSDKAPQETIIIAITKDAILVQGRKVIALNAIDLAGDDVIEELKKELVFLSGIDSNTAQAPSADGKTPEGLKVTIIGDENISYDYLRKILTTCQHANYTSIAFAATQVAKKDA